MLAQTLEYGRRRRPLRHQHCRRADRQREDQRIAEPVGKEEFGRRKDDVRFRDSEDWLPVQIGNRLQIGVNVNGAFRRAG